MDTSDTHHARLARAVSHPLRAQVLTKLADAEASPSDIARMLGVPLGRVSYHVQALRDLGCIELVRSVPRRGAMEHYYRAVVRPLFDDALWARLPVPLRRQFTGHILRELSQEVSAAAPAGGFDRPGAHIVRVPLDLDERGWQELSGVVADLIATVDDIAGRSAARRAGSRGGSPSVLAILHYTREPAASGPQAGRRHAQRLR
jgi:DNA-binding transcriptional ArsR family regulator